MRFYVFGSGVMGTEVAGLIFSGVGSWFSTGR